MSKHLQRKWKAAWRDDYLKWIGGFANDDGGAPVSAAHAARWLEGIAGVIRHVCPTKGGRWEVLK